MAKCRRCGRTVFSFLLKDNLCDGCRATVKMEKEQAQIANSLAQLKSDLSDQQALFDKLKAEARAEVEKETADLVAQSKRLESQCDSAAVLLAATRSDQEKSEKSAANAREKVRRSRELLKAIEHGAQYFETDGRIERIQGIIESLDEYLSPTVELTLQCLDMKELRKRYKENEKNIQATFEKYKDRYTTKANIAIYRLMVIALSAELQNILHSISYGKIEDALGAVTAVTDKYYAIATDGSQNIAPTIKKFIGELNYYFQEAVKIEYEYYVQKERAKEEQRAIREQMRQEAEERRELERQQKKIEKEEGKFVEQIAMLTSQAADISDPEKYSQLQDRIKELQEQLANVSAKKERIIHLQNGKAGNVYVISNLGSFGDDVFKIGMTRREEPMDRIRELGDASVPFPFDVHAMIFSDDAVSLETQLHHILNDRRVNKVNLRKEFFRIGLGELESLVEDTCPTASFKRTMLAEQYRQSLSIDHVIEVDSTASLEDFDEE